MRINLLPNENNMFVLEGYTRPAMKQAKGISSGEGLYACSIIFDKRQKTTRVLLENEDFASMLLLWRTN